MKIKTRSNDFGDFWWNYYRLGPFHWERDSFTFIITKEIFYNINISWPGYAYDNLVVGDEATWKDPDTGKFLNMGPGKRLEFTIWPFGHWLIGLEKKNTFGKWSFKYGHRRDPKKYGRVTWSPPRNWLCQNLTGETKKSICGAFRWHQCPYKIK